MTGKYAGRTVRRDVTITEREDDWVLTEDPELGGHTCPTAAEALASVRQVDSALVQYEGAGAVIRVITWCPTTRVGAMVVRALQDAPAGEQR